MAMETIAPILVSVFFLTGAGVVLSALLVLAEKKILHYGPCKIDINNKAKILTVDGGASLLSSLSENGVFIPSACGGRGSCAYCKVIVHNGGGIIGPVEEPYLSDEERKKNVRLSCQVKVRGDIAIQIPKELFSVKKFRGFVEHKKTLTHDILGLRIKLLEPDTILFNAGQYIQLESKEYAGHDAVIRAYSIASIPSDNHCIELVIRLVPEGICTTWVFNYLKENEEISFSGTYGEFSLSDSDAPIICIAGGSGMAPLWSILQDMHEKNITRPTTYFFGALTQKDLFYTKELNALAQAAKWFTYVPALSKEPEGSDWKGEQGLITNVVAKHFPDTSHHEAYLCGSPGMIDACIQMLTKGGMPETRIFYDKFA